MNPPRPMAAYPARFRAHQGSRRGAYIYRVASLFSPPPSRSERGDHGAREDYPATCAIPTMRRYVCGVLFDAGQVCAIDCAPILLTTVRPLVRSRPRCERKRIRRRRSSLRTPVPIGHVVGPPPASLLSLDRPRLQSVAVRRPRSPSLPILGAPTAVSGHRRKPQCY